jgi:hypothetical protein
MLKVVDVIGVARTGAYESDASLATRMKIVRMARIGLAARLRVIRLVAGCITRTAEHGGVPDACVSRLLPLTCLARELVEAIPRRGPAQGAQVRVANLRAMGAL